MTTTTLRTQPVYGLPIASRPLSYDFLMAGLPGLVHRWKFTEASGNFVDYVGGLTLSASGSFSYGVTGPVGGAVTFGAAAKGVSSGLGNLPVGAAARTVVVVYGAATTVKECLFSWGASGGSTWWSGFQEELDTWGNDLYFTALPAGHWHMYVAYYEGSGTGTGGVILDNGAPITHAYGTLGTSTGGNFQTGLSTVSDGQLTGTIDDIAVFNRRLSGAELSTLYAAAKSSAIWT